MKIEIIKCLKDNYSYVIIDETNNYGCVVDPSESDPIINFLDKHQIKLKFILNTHHHYDHVGGNKNLKKRYGSKIIGFKKDRERIPGIDICLEDKEVWEKYDFKAKIYHIPGHTSGHICFHFPKEKFLFTGDTLFSLGCGRIFEGTYKQMFNSLQIIKSFPLDTKIYCGHEYTLNNSNFCTTYDKNNSCLLKMIKKIKVKLENGEPSIPSILNDELKCNIFLIAKDIASFTKLRDLKDNF